MIQRLIRKEERKNALVAIGKGGRALVKAMPKPVPLHEMRRPVRRALIISVELLVGLLVIGAVFIGIVYQRLERGTHRPGFSGAADRTGDQRPADRHGGQDRQCVRRQECR